MPTAKKNIFSVFCGLFLVFVFLGMAQAELLFEASLRNGDYGQGMAVDTMDPDQGGSPHVLGIVDSPDGVTYTATEENGRSNGLINWTISDETARNTLRSSGTISIWLTADMASLAAGSGGWLWGENFGFDQFRNGQGTFSIGASLVDDDHFRVFWNSWHNSVWYVVGETTLSYGSWYNIGFTWGGAEHDFEIWVNGSLVSSYDLEDGVSFPWGRSNSGTNFGIGDSHERGYNTYGSAVGVTFADVAVWNEYRAQGGTVAPDTGYLVTDDLWIRAVINTVEKGPIEAVWQQGGEDTTAADDQVIWGHFYADPNDVTWGSEDNPDLFVKIWFDHGGRLDVNFFHVSVPDIVVYSDYPYDGTVDEQGTTTMSTRYIRQYYEDGQSNSEEQ
jgi:hypothetical protein